MAAPKLLRDWVNHPVRLARDIKTGVGIVIPKGKILTIEKVRRGPAPITMKSHHCPDCGVRVTINVAWKDIEWIRVEPTAV